MPRISQSVGLKAIRYQIVTVVPRGTMLGIVLAAFHHNVLFPAAIGNLTAFIDVRSFFLFLTSVAPA
jgi:hypothetical protein